MALSRKLLVASLCIAAAAWLAGPIGRLLVVLPLLLFGPGYLVAPAPSMHPWLRSILWLGLSLSLLALLYQWATLAGLSLGTPILGALAALCALGVVWRLWRLPAFPSDTALRRYAGSTSWTILLLAIFALTLWTRLAHIRDLALPPWVDSLHHALMIRVAAERGQAPYALAPYLPVERLTYHWGYHVFMATAMRLAGLAVPEALPQTMLWVGQILNALCVPAYAALAVALWRRPLAGVAAGLVVGVISIMPAYYLSWGRYTLLLGLLMLPSALIALHEMLRAPRRGTIALAGTLLAGLALVHVVVLLLALVWACAAWLTSERLPIHFRLPQSHRAHGEGPHASSVVSVPLWLSSRLPQSHRAHGEGPHASSVVSVPLWLSSRWNTRVSRAGLLALALAGLLALVLTAPWMMMLLSRARPGTGGSTMHIVGNIAYNRMPMELLWSGNNRLLLALAGVGALLGCWRRWRAAAALLIWSALVLLLANPVWVGLPYLSILTNEIVAIVLFVPASLLIGAGAAVVDEAVLRRVDAAWARSIAFLRIALVLAIAGWSALQFQTVVRPDTVLANRADRDAIAWAAQSTPPNARFVVGTTAWLGRVDRGSDGGWWLLPLAGRQVSTPPVIFSFGPDDYARATQQQTAWLRARPARSPAELAGFMRRYGYEYVYATPQSGSFEIERLRESELFVEVYRNEGVSILQLKR